MTDSAYPDALPSQYRLHWYVLERVLGQGGFGITYLARDTNLDQTVAIKEYLPVDVATRRADTTVRPRSDEQAERYRWGLERFIQEARTLARFDHPNIVRVLSVFEHNGTAYMVMRFEEGENFGALLERKRTLPENELMRVLLPVLDGLALVHGANFIHRDIKPDNIHIRADGSPVLLDFGSARHAVGQVRTVTILVAPGYAPFEQYYSSGEDQGPWTDIYSLGATCYRAISGMAPMDAIARSKGILGSTRELLVPASAIGAGRYTAGFLKAVDHALAFAEKDRPQSIAAWRAELLESRPSTVPTRPAGSGPAARQPSAAPAAAPVARTAAIVVALAGVAVVGGGIGAYLMTRGVKPASQEAPVSPSGAAPVPPPAPTPAPAPIPPPVAVQSSPPVATPAAEPVASPTAAPPAERAAAPESKPKLPKPAAGATRADTGAKRKVDAKVAVVAPPPPPEAAPAPPAGPPPGDAAAFDYYRALAGKGDGEAALKVGDMYQSGRGVSQPSNNLAYLWFAIAEKRGAAGAGPKKDAAARSLQPLEIEQMERQALRILQSAR